MTLSPERAHSDGYASIFRLHDLMDMAVEDQLYLVQVPID